MAGNGGLMHGGTSPDRPPADLIFEKKPSRSALLGKAPTDPANVRRNSGNAVGPVN
jgi:hypothetical protein